MTTTVPSTILVPIETWVGAITSSACIGFTSLVPWLFNMTFFERRKSQQDVQTKNSRMDYLLSFSVGAILGDIFFHLIPESLECHLVELAVPVEVAERKVGLSIIAGIFMFIVVEMILERWSSQEDHREAVDTTTREDDCEETLMGREGADLIESLGAEHLHKILENNNNATILCNVCSHHTKESLVSMADSTNLIETKSEQTLTIRKRATKEGSESLHPRKLSETNVHKSIKETPLRAASLIAGQVIDPAGYLSLIANGIDNFTHGLAIGASFLVGPKVGLLTTFVIFIHEIPHEICDYAILVNSGFSRWDAVKAQSSVSLFGIMGTATALYFKSIDTLNAKTIWILPFSAGGFLHIALVNLLPEILSRGQNFRDSVEQIACVILGMAFMGAVALS